MKKADLIALARFHEPAPPADGPELIDLARLYEATRLGERTSDVIAAERAFEARIRALKGEPFASDRWRYVWSRADGAVQRLPLSMRTKQSATNVSPAGPGRAVSDGGAKGLTRRGLKHGDEDRS